MTDRIGGIIPVMLTPFHDTGEVDYEGLARLTEWYLVNGADALFAVCQSSEMQHLSLRERTDVAGAVVRTVNGRVPVLVSGHVSRVAEEQSEELQAMAALGADVVVLVTNRLDPEDEGGATLRNAVDGLLATLPSQTRLGLYECPAPFRRLLGDEEISHCARTGRFAVLKDVSCDHATLLRRRNLVEGTPLNIVNANAAIAYAAMKDGLDGFCGVMTNFHPDLYKWLLATASNPTLLSDQVASTLAVQAMSEAYGYPALAKLFHQRIGTFSSIRCRVETTDLRERVWAVEALLDHIMELDARTRSRVFSAVAAPTWIA